MKNKSRALPGKPVVISVLIPDPWFNIAKGTIVLCQDDSANPKDRAWWACTVIDTKDDKVVVRWTNFPTIKPFTVKRSAVAVLPPKGRTTRTRT